MKFTRFAVSSMLAVLTVLCASQSWALTCSPGHLAFLESAIGKTLHTSDVVDDPVDEVPSTAGTIALTTDGDNIIIWRADGKIVRIGCTSEQVTVLTGLPVGYLGSDPSRRKLFIATGANNNTLNAYNLDSLQQLGSPIALPVEVVDIDVLSTGCPIVAGYNPTTFQYEVWQTSDPAGACSIGSPQQIAPSATLMSVYGVTVKRSNDQIFVADATLGCIVDLSTEACITGPPLGVTPGGVVASQTDDVVYIGAGDDITVQNTTTGVWSTFNDQVFGGAADIAIIGVTVTCGNGVLDGGEQCDRSAGGHSVCCREDCTFAPAATSCADGNDCNGDEVCTGTGACAGGEAPTCDDGNECTDDGCQTPGGCFHDPNTSEGFACGVGNLCLPGRTCSAGVCQGGNPVQCSDSSNCTNDACIEDTGECQHLPRDAASMVHGQAASVKVQDALTDPKDNVQFQLKAGEAVGDGGGAANPGDPVTGSTDYLFCILDQVSPNDYRVLVEEPILHGGTCKNKACWKIMGKPNARKGLQYADPLGERGRITQLKMKFGASGKSSLQVNGKKRTFPGLTPYGLEYMAQNSDLIAILIGNHGVAWEGNFGAPAVSNDAGKMKFSDKLP